MAPSGRRVAHLVGPSAGGIRRHVRYLASHPPAGFDTFGVWGPPDLEDYFDVVPFYRATLLDRLRPVKRAQLVHAHGLGPGLIALSPLRTTPVVVTVHTDIQTQGRTATSERLRSLARYIAARADAVIAVSDDVARAFPHARVIAPAVDPLPAPNRSREAVRRELGVSDERTVVVCVARLHPDKGLDTLIDAMSGLDADGWICGDGPLKGELERRTAGGNVKLLGHRGDVSDILAAADLFALPSVGEAYGIAVLEALQSGLPVVTSDAGAMPSLVGDAGIVTPVRDRAAFAAELKRLVENHLARMDLAIRARRRTFEEPDEVVARIGTVYDSVMR